MLRGKVCLEELIARTVKPYRFAVKQGPADFQGRLFDPKIFWTGCKFRFQVSAGSTNILDRVENWVSAVNYFENSFEQGDFFSFISKYSLNKQNGNIYNRINTPIRFVSFLVAVCLPPKMSQKRTF